MGWIKQASLQGAASTVPGPQGPGPYLFSPQVGDYWQLTRSANASTKFPVGTEYAIGLNLPALTIDAVGIEVTAAGAAGSTFLVGLRSLSGNPTGFGAPLFTAAFSLVTANSAPVTTLTAPVAIPAGPYVLCWCTSVDSAATATVQYSGDSGNLQMFGVARATGMPAAGHGPMVTTLNTGVTSTSALPTTVVVGSISTNQNSNAVPQVIVHRSA